MNISYCIYRSMYEYIIGSCWSLLGLIEAKFHNIGNYVNYEAFIIIIIIDIGIYFAKVVP